MCTYVRADCFSLARSLSPAFGIYSRARFPLLTLAWDAWTQAARKCKGKKPMMHLKLDSSFPTVSFYPLPILLNFYAWPSRRAVIEKPGASGTDWPSALTKIVSCNAAVQINAGPSPVSNKVPCNPPSLVIFPTRKLSGRSAPGGYCDGPCLGGRIYVWDAICKIHIYLGRLHQNRLLLNGIRLAPRKVSFWCEWFHDRWKVLTLKEAAARCRWQRVTKSYSEILPTKSNGLGGLLDSHEQSF